jgi:hypothetical protein
MELSDHSLRSTSARWLCVELGDHGCSRSVCGGGGSLHRSPTPDLHVSECPGIGHCLALGAAGRNDFHCLPTGSAFVASHSESAHSRFPPFSGTLSSVDGHNHSCNSIPGLLVAIKIGSNPCERSLVIRIRVVREPEPHRGLPAFVSRVGAPAGVSEPVSQGVDAAQSCLDW